MLGAQGCTLHSIDNYGSLTAQKRSDSKDRSGFSFVNCTVTGSSPHLLGRAWGPYSRVVYAYTYMENSIIPFGWSNWNDAYREEWVLFLLYSPQLSIWYSNWLPCLNLYAWQSSLLFNSSSNVLEPTCFESTMDLSLFPLSVLFWDLELRCINWAMALKP